MKFRAISAAFFLIVGLAFFTLGLLVILHESTVVGLISFFVSDTETIEIVGVITLFLGQAVMIFGVVKSTSHKFLSSVEAERQRTVAGVAQNIELLHTKFQADRQAIVAGYNQTIAKIDTLIANQKVMATATVPRAPLSSSCKFCGSKIEPGHFCPKCGKAN